MICHHSISSLLKISKNGSMNGLPQETKISTGVDSFFCVKGGQKS